MRFIGEIDLSTLKGQGYLVKDAAKPEAASEETP
jgi:hypothetical protein